MYHLRILRIKLQTHHLQKQMQKTFIPMGNHKSKAKGKKEIESQSLL